MIEAETPPPSATDSSDQSASPRRSWFRVSLASMMLATVVIAIWTSVFVLISERIQLSAELPTLRDAARELIVEPDRLSAVHKHPFHGGETWEVHIPRRPAYEIRFASEGIKEEGLAKPEEIVAISPGRHRIELQHVDGSAEDEDVLKLLLDSRQVWLLMKPADWNPSRASTGGSLLTTSEFHSADEPFVLLRRRFFIPSGPNSSIYPTGPANGVLLWIQPR